VLKYLYNLYHGKYASHFDIDNSSGHSDTAVGGGANEVKAEEAQTLAETVIHIKNYGRVLRESVIYCLVEKFRVENLK
jgi:hypothetical protein